MRSITLLALLAVLGGSPVAMAEEETTDDESSDTRVEAENVSNDGGFAPSEEVEADTAVAFPTDI